MPRRLRSWLDPDRFCSCGLEREVSVVRKVDRRTGETSGLIWAVACPEIRLLLHSDGSAVGNGLWGHGHQADVDCWEPTWLSAAVRTRLVEDGAL